MATKFLEGFDDYGPAGQYSPSLTTLLGKGGWSFASGGNVNLAASLNGVAGTSLSFTGDLLEAVDILVKPLNTNLSTIIFGVRFSMTQNGATTGVSQGITFYDGTTPQCTINVVPTSGQLQVVSGDGANGSLTVLGTSSTGTTFGVAYYLEGVITFAGSGAGTFALYLNGTSILSGTGTTIQSGNAWTNTIGLMTQVKSGTANYNNAISFDDMYVFDTTTAHNAAVLNTNPIVYTQLPSADSSIQFTNNGNVVGKSTSTNNTNFSQAANRLYLAAIKPVVNCTINDIVLFPETSSAGGNFKGVIYADSAGAPGTLLSSGTQVTGTTAATNLLLPLVTPQSLVANTQYWIGFINDTTTNFLEANTLLQGYQATNTYTSGAPGTAPAMTSGLGSLIMYGACSGASTNWESVSLNPPIGDLSSVITTTTTNQDLYQFPNLPGTTSQIHTVGVSVYGRLATAGADTINCNISSSGTISAGNNAGQVPSVNYGWLESYNDTDPHTGSSWTPAAVNASTAGPELVT